MKFFNKYYEFSRFDLSTIILFVCLFVFVSCEENQTSKRLIIISGKLIDSPQNVNFSDYTLTARSIFGTKEETLASTKLNEDGTFRMEYYSEGSYVGNNLRIAVTPILSVQSKLEFLPYGESWYKEFYISDYATIVIKVNSTLLVTDTLFISTNSGNFRFGGSVSNNILGKIKVLNFYDQFFYKTNNSTGRYIIVNPTGNPIVDTITLDINP